MKHPVIGLIPLVDEEKESLWMLPGYMDGIREAGGLPLMLPLTADAEEIEQLALLCDGLLLTGGHDVSPSVYGAKAEPYCGIPSSERDAMEAQLLDVALERDIPVFGICRGIQFLNAHLGGTLYQDLPIEHPSDIEHHQTPPYDVPVHTVAIAEGSDLRNLLGCDTLRVNSYHHQAVRTLAPGLEAEAVSPDGLIEAVRLPGKRYVRAVQWHPEFSHLVDAESRKLFSSFIAAADHKE